MPETTRPPCTPYLCCRDAARALGFYETAFGAEIRQRWTAPDGRIGHAELAIGPAVFYLSDEWPEEGVFSPAKLGGTAVALLLLVTNVDAFAQRAVAAGATLARAPRDEPHGERSTTAEMQARVGGAFEIE